MREPPFKGGWGEGKGKERKGIHTHTRMAMDGCAALRCAALQWVRYNAMRCNGMEMGRDFAVVVVSSCFLFLDVVVQRARAPDRCCCCCYCWLLAVQVHNSNAMQWN